MPARKDERNAAIVARAAAGEPHHAIAQAFGIHPSRVSHLVREAQHEAGGMMLVEQERPIAPDQDSEGVRWLAMLLRQAALLLVSGIEIRYGLKRRTPTE